jgi:hypothetical protein
MIAQAWSMLSYCSRHLATRATLLLSSLALLTVLVLSVAHRSAVSHVDQLKSDLKQQTVLLNDTDRAQEFLETFQHVSAEIQIIETKLDYAATPGQLIEDVTKLAARHRVAIVSEAYEEGRRNGVLQTLNSELSVRGSYAAIRGFLLEIPELRAWTEVHEVLLERGRDAGAVNAKIHLATFRRATPADS